MHVSRSLRASAIFLSFFTSTDAWVLHRKPAGTVARGKEEDNARLPRGEWLDGEFKKRQGEVTELNCPNDRWEKMLDSNPDDRVKTFCNEWLGIGPATVTQEVTPTITITTSASVTSVITSTERSIVTKTVNKTVVTTVAAVQKRAANILAVAEDVIASVIESGTAAPTTSKSSQRLQAEAGLANACSCKMVDPTATETSFFTVPPVYDTVGVRKVFVARVTDTKVFTATTTVTVVSEDSLSAGTSAASTVVSSDPSTENAASTESRGSSMSEATVPSVSALSSTILPMTTSAPLSAGNGTATDSTSPIVTAIPFSCPENAGQRIEQVVDGVRLDYLVLCNTQLVTADRRGFPVISVEDETACAAQCSVINARTGQDACKAALFTPYGNGRNGGDCTITTNDDPEYIDSPGSISIVHTGTLANGDECANINSTETRSSVDISAVVASVTKAPLSVSTPGLVTQSANGGVFETYVSANSTDASGYVHWSWYAVSASSSFWWAVYSTSWECTATLTRTIVTQQTQPQTIVSVVITTIINGATTTYISGTSTRIVTNGNGVSPPTFVPASTTEGNGEVTTFFSEATATSTGANGVETPSDNGAGNATVSFATSTFFSTGSNGVIAPSSLSRSVEVETVVSSGDAQLSSSGSTYTSNGTGGAGVIPPPSATGGTGVFSISSGTLVVNSTGSGGILPPSSAATPSIQEVANSTIVSGGTAVLTVSGSAGTAVSTGGMGVVPPSPTGNVTVVVTVSITSGVASFATSSSTFVSNGTGDSGVIPPASTRVSSGGASFATSNSTRVASSTGDSGIIPPVTSESAPSSSVQTNLVVSSTGGSGNRTVEGSTAVSTGSGGSGVIPPPSTNASNPPTTAASPSIQVNVSVSAGTAQFSTSNSTIAVFSTGSFGIIPPTTRNITLTTTTTILASSLPVQQANTSSAGGSGFLSTQGSTAVTLSTGSGGIIPPSSVTPSSSSNATTASSSSTGPPFTNSAGNRSGTFSRRTSTGITTASTGVIVPSSNSSAPLPSTTPPSSGFPSTSLNSSSVSTGPPFSNSGGNRSGTFSRSSSISVSVTPSASVNISSTTTGPPFSNSGDNRSGSFSRTSSTRVSDVPSVSFNVSSSSTGPPFTNSGGDRSGSFSGSTRASLGSSSGGVVTPGTLTTTATVTIVPSSSVPAASLNVTSSGILSSSIGSSSVPVASSNSTTIARSSSTSGPSSSPPAPSFNGTTSVPILSTLVPPPFGGNSTAPSGTGTGSVGTPTPSLNATVSVPVTTGNVTSSFPSITPSVSLNITTSFLPTGNSSIPSATPTLSFNSTTSSDICPTVPVLITVTEVATSVQVVTTTVVQTVLTGPEESATADALDVNLTSSGAIGEVTSPSATADSDTAATSSAAPQASPVDDAAQPSATDLQSRFRASGTPATEAQIEAACADLENVVLNPMFAVQDESVPSWTVDDSDPNITVGTEDSPTGNGTIAQFKSQNVGSALAITQPLTLCPDQQYNISAKHRQEDPYADCSVVYRVGAQEVLSVTPTTNWTTSSILFTAGSGVEGASVNLTVTASCAGFSGFLVGEMMRVEVSEVDVHQQKNAQKRSVIGRLSRHFHRDATNTVITRPVFRPVKFGAFVFTKGEARANVSKRGQGRSR
ncbi:hypothetical protein ACN47E_000697 [Coniothyrium glycines]